MCAYFDGGREHWQLRAVNTKPPVFLSGIWILELGVLLPTLVHEPPGGKPHYRSRVLLTGREEALFLKKLASSFFSPRRDGRVAEGGGLLNRYTVKSRIGGSNPPLSAISPNSELTFQDLPPPSRTFRTPSESAALQPLNVESLNRGESL